MADFNSDSDEEIEKKDKVVEPEPEEDTTCANANVVTKYQEAAKIANAALSAISDATVAGVTAVELVGIGEKIINDMCALIYRTKVKGKPVDKGIAFPVCISVNNCVCHNNPLDSDEDKEIIKDNDLVKIDLGVHVDGYIAVVAHTVFVGYKPDESKPMTGAMANCYSAAYTAAEAAACLIRPGGKNKDVTEHMKKICEAYGVNSICGTLMHQVKRFVMDGNKMVMLRDEPEQKIDSCEFEVNEVFVVDIAVTSGEGKPVEKDKKATIYKRVVDRKFNLRIKNSRAFYSEVTQRFPTLPFSLRYLNDERIARVGMRECLGHELIVPYPILYEKPDDIIVHVKFTVLVLPGGNTKITGMTLTPPGAIDTKENDAKVPDDIKTILAEEKARAAKKAAKKAKKKAAK